MLVSRDLSIDFPDSVARRVDAIPGLLTLLTLRGPHVLGRHRLAHLRVDGEGGADPVVAVEHFDIIWSCIGRHRSHKYVFPHVTAERPVPVEPAAVLDPGLD